MDITRLRMRRVLRLAIMLCFEVLRASHDITSAKRTGRVAFNFIGLGTNSFGKQGMATPIAKVDWGGASGFRNNRNGQGARFV